MVTTDTSRCIAMMKHTFISRIDSILDKVCNAVRQTPIGLAPVIFFDTEYTVTESPRRSSPQPATIGFIHKLPELFNTFWFYVINWSNLFPRHVSLHTRLMCSGLAPGFEPGVNPS